MSGQKKHSDTMQDCLQHSNESTMPQRITKQMTTFIPKDLPYSSKERKMIALQESFSDIDHCLLGVNSNSKSPSYTPPQMYPLSKMSETTSQKNKVPQVEHLEKNEKGNSVRLTKADYLSNENLSAKHLKQLYDIRSAQCLPFPRSIDLTKHIGHSSTTVQNEFNESLSMIRDNQKSYSDIFAQKLLTTDTTTDSSCGSNGFDINSVTAMPSRNLREVQEEIQPSGKGQIYRTTSQMSAQRSLDNQSITTARERYYKELSTNIGNQKHNYDTWRDNATTTSNSSYSDSMNEKSDLFGNPVIDIIKPLAKIAMLRLHNIPLWMSERDLVAGIKSCHCYVTKIWLPYNILLGTHKGVGSLIVRESWSDLSKHEHDTVSNSPFCDTDDDILEKSDHNHEPFFLLHKWLLKNNIIVAVEEFSTE